MKPRSIIAIQLALGGLVVWFFRRHRAKQPSHPLRSALSTLPSPSLDTDLLQTVTSLAGKAIGKMKEKSPVSVG